MKKIIQGFSLALAMFLCVNAASFGTAEDDCPEFAPATNEREISESLENVENISDREQSVVQTHETTDDTSTLTEVVPKPSCEPASEPTAEASPQVTADSNAAPVPEATVEPEQTPETPPEGTAIHLERICNLEEHVHSEACYNASDELICALSEHVHNDSCFEAPKDSEASDEIENQAPVNTETKGKVILADYVDPALWRGVRPSSERGMMIPMLFQTDYTQTVCILNGRDRSVATSGCGATSLSMVIAYLTGNTEQNPYVLFRDSVKNGYYRGEGWSHSTLSHYASLYNIHYKWFSNDAESILYALESGYPVIAHMGRGIFTRKGHYLVLRGLTEDGLVLVNDPFSRKNSEMAFPIGTLLKQTKTSEPFMICWNDNMKAFEVSKTEGAADR